MREAHWQRLGDLLSGLRPTAVQLAELLDLCEEAGQFGRDAVHYQAWSQQVGALLEEIQTTPAVALSDAERNELIRRLWIAWEETGIRLTRLLTQVTGISLAGMHREEPGILLTGGHHEEPGILPTGVPTASPSILLTGGHHEESGILPTGVHRSLASQAEVLPQPPLRLTREDQEPGGGFSLLD